MGDTATEMVKLCSGPCCRARALSWFRPRAAGSPVRHSLCRECHALAEKERRQRRRRGEIGSFAVELGRARDRDEASPLCKIAVAGFGGVYALARKLWVTYEAAEAGSPTASRILLALLRLQELTAPARPDYAMMDDADLNERVEQLGRKLLGKK